MFAIYPNLAVHWRSFSLDEQEKINIFNQYKHMN